MKCVDCGDEVAVPMYLDVLQVGFEDSVGEDYYMRHEPELTGLRCIECGMRLIRLELEGTVAEIVAKEAQAA